MTMSTSREKCPAGTRSERRPEWTVFTRETIGTQDVASLEGFVVLVDKPLGKTSFDVVYHIRLELTKRTGEKVKVGHAGTLDPRATGLLVVCVGTHTKAVERLTEEEKEYEGRLELGAVTPSFDTETEISDRKEIKGITVDDVKRVFEKFIGAQWQTPPMYSAVKVRGHRLYKSARKGNVLSVIPPRRIAVHSFDITKTEFPSVDFRVRCSKGTYIRSLANDIGKELGCGAYLSSLRRTRSGTYNAKDALTLEETIAAIRSGGENTCG